MFGGFLFFHVNLICDFSWDFSLFRRSLLLKPELIWVNLMRILMVSFNLMYWPLYIFMCSNTQYTTILFSSSGNLCNNSNECFNIFLQEMEGYIRGLIPNLAQLRDIPASFVQTYCRIAARKFFFFCDPARRGLTTNYIWNVLSKCCLVPSFRFYPFSIYSFMVTLLNISYQKNIA